MAKWIKNDSGGNKTWIGQLVADQTYYEIQSLEESKWANNSDLLSDIGSGAAIVAKDDSGSNDITDVNTAINYLKGDMPKEVISQKEKDDITLKLANFSASVDAGTGEALIEIQVPGTYTSGHGRFVESGTAWFDIHHAGDQLDTVEVVDKDNILGYGAGLVVKKYHDEDVPSANQGWIMNPNEPSVHVEALGGYGFIPAQLYFRIRGKKSSGNYSGTLRVNLKWGKAE